MSTANETPNNKQPKTAVNRKVKLCIMSQDGSKLYARVRSDKKIESLLLNYCNEKNLDYNTLTFLFDGRRIQATNTPTELGMEDEDEIDAMFHHNGGGCC